MIKKYKVVRAELGMFDKSLLEKDEVIILTKTDVVSDIKEIKKAKDKFKEINKNVFVLSLYDDKSIKALVDGLVKMLRKG